MSICGKNLVAGEWSGTTTGGFTAFHAINNEPMNIEFADATEQEVETAILQAAQAFESYSQLPTQERATFLRAIGDEILALGDELVEMACAETGLPAARIQGERGRTVGQLAMFANMIEAGEYQAIIEHAQPNREPLPKPDTRLGYLPLGVVGVFAASNFPLAFSTAGGDTASALAAGCPVVMKAHSAHPATAELVALAISRAITKCQLHPGVFSLLQGKNYGIASQIVKHPKVKAVGFTGSERVGMILQRQIHERAEPIPFYGELGSVNPQFIMANKLAQDTQNIAQELVNSLLMGQGQFCTSPGIWVYPDDGHAAMFEQAAADAIAATEAGVMLTPEIATTYKNCVQQWQEIAGVRLLAQGKQGAEHFCTAALFATDFATFKANAMLSEEVFGSSALLVRVGNTEEMLELVDMLKGNLTASIHALDSDLSDCQRLAIPLAHKVGRLIYNQMPTGVEVCASMNHGGPFPASTDIRATSVGGEAIKRFQRPICYQNMPIELLPDLLKD
ncbi:aldehyde dehydrogenase (NADP(+)) [Thalassotalea marina]|uniref:Aldehyde dehydrogenase n=1 Tax=Thalassotalea marina TaxID=1673741 RepID=A0A919BEY6_9GAMM|nr:aldehyde dehydrogenase (NADP(+)) [Thalassotalea marina]GHF85003.1 aldehyde dehydrogenase [Thalassotalea marina]